MTQLPAPQEWHAGIPRSTRTATIFGFFVMAAFLLGFGSWASTAPIAGAIIAGGSFVATGENKIIQHLEGGVIKEIRVREGDVVEKGDVLIDLDEREPRTELRRLELRKARAVAQEARLIAEMNEKDDVIVPQELVAQNSNPDIAEILERERQALAARRNAVKTEIATLMEGVDALNQRVEGGKVQLTAVRQQLAYVEEELEGKKSLLKKGLIRKPEVLSLERAKANLSGEIGRLNGEIGDARERIARIMEQVAGVETIPSKAAVEEMHKVSAELKDVRELINAAKAVVERVSITAPVNGIVVKLQYHTPGGVIEPGKPIMEILPIQAELLIEAQVKLGDIDVVKRGQHAMIRLSALNRRITPMIPGEVVYVSADSLVSGKQETQQTPSDVYIARIKLDLIEVSKLPDFAPTPGMPVEVYIKTADRTFLEYLFKPIEDSMSRAFREL
ncbi:HlyD family type I secretion periplasmic adaptor subunit [Methyloceanibacter marginalis]|uniref:HlyD family type I secretion periplasmic adaptor subunit n=1 Tax=Methyloceanibacter marginalis TaxID=1774971 RepID=UPI00084CE04C|nr:HlyD family type I secretion periplasmic adaptor subunit [Methyloceanibacter marginalis]